MEKEHISHESGSREAWICLCGNTPGDNGFYPCDEKGAEIEPDKFWVKPLYVCDNCGRIIHQDSLEVIGRKIAEAGPKQGK
jgi:hypothetical protein